jgi:cell division protein FtsB
VERRRVTQRLAESEEERGHAAQALMATTTKTTALEEEVRTLKDALEVETALHSKRDEQPVADQPGDQAALRAALEAELRPAIEREVREVLEGELRQTLAAEVRGEPEALQEAHDPLAVDDRLAADEAPAIHEAGIRHAVEAEYRDALRELERENQALRSKVINLQEQVIGFLCPAK